MKKVSVKPREGNCKIAVIGIGCYYPGAKSPLELWENILARRQQFREMPDQRLPNHEYYDPDPSARDKTYQNKAAVIDGYQFDWLGRKIPKQTYESTDIVHWLALDTALKALEDAGMGKGAVPEEKTGVILGNTLTGEFTRSNNMLLRWPYIRKVLRASAKEKGFWDKYSELENTIERYYKSVFAPVTEDTLAGGLANTIAGRICNYLDIHGGGYIVDGACSSSLLAVITAANYLELGQMDMAIAGGVDVSLDTFELIGFAKTKALTPDEMRVYDKNGKGFLPGEGCGMVVLKRLEDAKRDGDQIYAILDGWGISSDGKGGITAPSAAGQSRALKRAYKKAGFDTAGLDFIEGHGTGTTVGDKVELEGINMALNHEKQLPKRSCGVTSFKSIVGHTKAAAGIGAFIKTVISVNQRILPPTAGLQEFNPIFEDKADTIYPVIHGQVKELSQAVKAGVSAMGFGGINSHVLLHSGETLSEKFRPSIDPRKLMVSNQSHELFLFTAPNKAHMLHQIRNSIGECKGISYAEMADYAFTLNKRTDFAYHLRAAIVAGTPFELADKLATLAKKLNDWNDGSFISLENNTVILGYKKDQLRIGGLFPGQGSQKLNMTYKLLERYDWVKEIFEQAKDIFKEDASGDVLSTVFKNVDRAKGRKEIAGWKNDLKQTNIAQPAITLASLTWLKYLEKLGIELHTATGHSLGELMAFYSSGLMNEETLLRFASFRGRSMAEHGSGIMASLVCSKSVAEGYIKKISGYATIANTNAPEQTVISGEPESIRQIIKLAEKDDIGAVELPVSAAFHSKLVEDVGRAIKSYPVLKSVHKSKNNTILISSMNGKPVDEKVDLNEYFSSQAVSRVDFISTVNEFSKHCDIMVEVGPGRVLSGLVSSVTGNTKAFPVEVNAEDDLSLNVMLGNVFVMGGNIRITELYKERLIREFIPAFQKQFLVNPLERSFPESFAQNEHQLSSPGFGSDLIPDIKDRQYADYLKARSNFISDVIQADFKYFVNNGHDKMQVVNEEPVAVQADVITRPEMESAGTKDARSLLYEKIETITGFSSGEFKDHMKLLDDFNLDSIKSGSLLAEYAKNLDITGKISVAALSNASIGDILSKVEPLIAANTPAREVVTDKKEKAASAGLDIEESVIKMIEDKTGFPADTIKPEYRLLDDLNLDSIKAGAFISEIKKNFGIQGNLGLTSQANATVLEIITAIRAYNVDNTEIQTIPEKVKDDSVKSFTVRLLDDPLSVNKQVVDEFWKDKSIVIVHDEDNKTVAEDLARQLKIRIPKTIALFSRELHLLNGTEYDCILVLLPQEEISRHSIIKSVEMLTTVTGALTGTGLLGFLQFNNGRFGREMETGEQRHHSVSAVSFAASLHHERNDVKIRVVEVDKKMPVKTWSDYFLKEFTTTDTFIAAGYDNTGKRRRMVYEKAVHRQPSDSRFEINDQDIILATGGAKGITAECVLALAEKHQCKVAMVGSSPLNKEVRQTLKRYEEKQLTAQYYVCNLSDPETVKQTVSTVLKELGDITMVIHGAGRNIPRRADQVSYADAMDEISPKLLGLTNLYEVLKGKQLKYFSALSSIIGVTGMPGNAWYAFSNETLDLFMREIGRKHGIKTRTLAYSVWNKVGMGARMGSDKVLAGMGIGSISPDSGTQEFISWIDGEADDQQVVITSEMGGLDTWYVSNGESKKNNRYLEEIREFEPGKKLSVRAVLSRNSDFYLEDHNYNGSLLFPTVFGIEAMTQAALLLTGREKVHGVILENISLEKPIVVPESGETEVEIKAEVNNNKGSAEDPQRVFVGISTEHTGFDNFHFSAEITFKDDYVPAVAKVDLPKQPLLINPASDLYSWLLFQGPRFQHIQQLFALSSNFVELTVSPVKKDPAVSCFSEEKRKGFVLGSPLLRDVLLQSVQLYLTTKNYLPIGIKRWEIGDIDGQVSGGVVISTLKDLKDDTGICNVKMVNDGRIVEKIEGYVVKALADTPDYPSPEKLADLSSVFREVFDREINRYQSFINREISYAVYKHYENFNQLGSEARHTIESDVFKRQLSGLANSALGNDVDLSWEDNGKPVLRNSDHHISVSHSRSVLLMLTGIQEQGCDIEFIEKRSDSEWADLFDNKFSDIIEKTKKIDHDKNISATRIWGVRESVIKSAGQMPLDIVVDDIFNNGIIFSVKTGNRVNYRVLTFPMNILPNNSYMVSILVDMSEERENNTSKQTEGNSAMVSYNPLLGGFTHRFYTTFKDCKSFFGKTHFTNYPAWMGSVRELVLSPIAEKLLKDLSSGEYGMVTNESGIQIIQDTDTLTPVVGNLWITDKSDFSNSFIDLSFEFNKKQSQSDELTTLAKCHLSTTWVKIVDRGIVKKAPIPAYFLDFLNKYVHKKPLPHQLVPENRFPCLKDLGDVTYQSADNVRPEIMLYDEIFNTGITNGNAVGNLYYSNYYDWQSKIMEKNLFELAPEFFLSNGRNGEFKTIASNVKHLQEAMPFENISVCMYLDRVYERGIRFYFEYFSVHGYEKRKLAYGSNIVVWCRRTSAEAVPVAEEMPSELSNVIKEIILV